MRHPAAAIAALLLLPLACFGRRGNEEPGPRPAVESVNALPDLAHVASRERTMPQPAPEDVATVDGVVTALYRSRGINSIQLVRDRERWWVLTILWDVERPGVEIPDVYVR